MAIPKPAAATVKGSANAYLYETNATLADSMRRAMETHMLIQQAKGIIIIAQQHCSPDYASELRSIPPQQHRHGHGT